MKKDYIKEIFILLDVIFKEQNLKQIVRAI